MSRIFNKFQFQIVQSNSIIHYVNNEIVIISKKNFLYRSIDSGRSWEKWLEVPVDLLTIFQFQSKLGRRLFRQYIYHVVPGEKEIIVFGFKKIFFFDAKTKGIISEVPIVGSRPLVVTEFKGDIYYGEYTSNPRRNPIRIFKSNVAKTGFEVFYTFDNIRHIHSIQCDPYSDKLFVTTGDEDHECIIGFFEDRSFIPLVKGSQQTRGIQLLFSEDFIYYATDAPHEKNYIYQINRKTKKKLKVQAVGGPVFYGTKIEELMFFSTVCEPSKINNQDQVELWCSGNGEKWYCIRTFNKDIYHMKLFQYGQLFFARGPGDKTNLWISTFATEMDQKILKVPLK